MTISDSKKIPLPALLSALGHVPSKARQDGADLWYASPFRRATEPNFHVSLAKNLWFDFGLGLGGDVADFAQRYFRCGLPEALRRLSALFPEAEKMTASPAPEETLTAETPAQKPEKEALRFIEAKPLAHPALVKYLTAERAIRPQTAQRFLQEVHFAHAGTGKQYFAAGLRNMAGGWEIRNPYFKSCLGSKAMTHLPGPQATLSVFEGALDFLSGYDYYGAALLGGHVLVLHSMAFVEAAAAFAQAGKFERIYAYFDNDDDGQTALATFRERFAERLEPCHALYFPCKDFNEWAVRRAR